MNKLIDSHCHLNMSQYSGNLDEVLARAKNYGVSHMQTICTNRTDIEPIMDLVTKYSHIYGSIGIHPNEVEHDNIISSAELVELTKHDKIISIGETGLDYYYANPEDATALTAQYNSFMQHIEASQLTGLPLVIHARDCDQDMINIFRKHKFASVLHCFTGTQELADAALEAGSYISISGIISFKTASNLRDIVKNIPLDKLLIETDSPYLAPVPMRGKCNEPGFVFYVAQTIAEIKEITIDQVVTQTYENFFQLFDKIPRDPT
jgi:TatD DNase family protein